MAKKIVELRAQQIEWNSISLSGAAQGETPLIAVLNYAQLSTPIEQIFGHKYSEIFTIASSQQLQTRQEIGGLEYAVLMLGVKVILLLDDKTAATAQPQAIVLQLKDRLLSIAGRFTGQSPQAAKLAKLKQAPLLSKFIRAGQLKIVCGIYDRDRETVEIVDRS